MIRATVAAAVGWLRRSVRRPWGRPPIRTGGARHSLCARLVVWFGGRDLAPCPACGSRHTQRDGRDDRRGASLLWLIMVLIGLALATATPEAPLDRPLWFNALVVGTLVLGALGWWLRWGDGDVDRPMYC